MITKEQIRNAMEDMLQIPERQCLYQIEAEKIINNAKQWIPMECSCMSYIDACTKALNATTYGSCKSPMRVFMCPEGQKAASPVFEIKSDRTVVLNGQEIGNIGDKNTSPTREDAKERIDAFIQHSIFLTGELIELLDIYGEKAEDLLIRIRDGEVTNLEWAMQIFDECEILENPQETEDIER